MWQRVFMNMREQTEKGAALLARHLQEVGTKGLSGKHNSATFSNPGIIDDSLLTRVELARRWKVSIETLKRRERAKILRPVRLNERLIRYRMSDVVRIEEEGYEGGEG
jgi:hypothetical protein